MKRSPLRPPTLDQVQAWRARPRKPLRQRGRKARREDAAKRTFSFTVKANVGGWCQGQRFGICRPTVHAGDHAHHIWPEDRDQGIHNPLRGAWLCAAAHRWVHDHPADAAKLGLLRPEVAS